MNRKCRQNCLCTNHSQMRVSDKWAASEAQLQVVKWALEEGKRVSMGRKWWEKGEKSRKDHCTECLSVWNRFQYLMLFSGPEGGVFSLFYEWRQQDLLSLSGLTKVIRLVHIFEHVLCKWPQWEWCPVWQVETSQEGQKDYGGCSPAVWCSGHMIIEVISGTEILHIQICVCLVWCDSSQMWDPNGEGFSITLPKCECSFQWLWGAIMQSVCQSLQQ
jgi:hypothetical protein